MGNVNDSCTTGGVLLLKQSCVYFDNIVYIINNISYKLCCCIRSLFAYNKSGYALIFPSIKDLSQ